MNAIQTWCYNDDRIPWKEIVRDLGVTHGVGELTLLRALKQVSMDKLYIDENGDLQRRKGVE